MRGAVAGFVERVDLRAAILERLPADGAGVAFEVAAEALPPAFGLGVDGVEAHTEAARDKGLVEIDRETLRAEAIETRLHFAGAFEGRALAGDVDDAARVDVAVSEPARPATELEPLGVEHIRHH